MTKFMRHDRHTPNLDGEIELTLRIEQTYNKYGNITRQEYFYPNEEGTPVSDRKIIQSYDSEGRHLNTLEYMVIIFSKVKIKSIGMNMTTKVKLNTSIIQMVKKLIP